MIRNYTIELGPILWEPVTYTTIFVELSHENVSDFLYWIKRLWDGRVLDNVQAAACVFVWGVEVLSRLEEGWWDWLRCFVAKEMRLGCANWNQTCKSVNFEYVENVIMKSALNQRCSVLNQINMLYPLLPFLCWFGTCVYWLLCSPQWGTADWN